MATLKIQTLASKDDERKALADFRNAILAVDPNSYLASLVSDELIEWFNRQVMDDCGTDLLSDREHWAGQAVDWKTQAALANDRAEDTAQRLARTVDAMNRSAEKAQAEHDRDVAFKNKLVELARDSESRAWDAYKEAQNNAVKFMKERDAAQAELAALKAQVKAQALKAQAALGGLAALIIDEDTAA